GTFNFTNFAITTSGGTGFLINSSGAPTINVGSGSTENVSATGGPAVDVHNANGSSSLPFDAVATTNSSGTGINLDSNGAAPSSGGALLSDRSSGAVLASAGCCSVKWTCTVNTIGSTTGTAMNISSTKTSASAVTFGHIAADGATNGIVVNVTVARGSLTETG